MAPNSPHSTRAIRGGGLQDRWPTRPEGPRDRWPTRNRRCLKFLGLKYILAEFQGFKIILAVFKGLKYNLGLGLRYIQVSKIVKGFGKTSKTWRICE
jgi:hypothetical protein